MDFFDKLGKTASKAYQYTAEKTTKLSKEAKLRMQMNQDKSSVDELYQKIGKRIYESHILEDDKTLEGDINKFLEQIDNLTEKIKDESNQILELKDKKECPNCYSKILKDFAFCPNCGAEQKEGKSSEYPANKEEDIIIEDHLDTLKEEEDD